ncbi:hypothetical protein PENANT_c006G09338 [Penicillium antarcticum]|uniref:Telomere replication protein EST3 n=1 Tax=Penicillium antarcticum TaxID=416450 RepID=A0A1V6QD76_9EURO|nr:uncharacterized protein N7508_009180 [Penicillium antarcticum]KAJ5294359.1 hypothetical protein N7508_009180 [Penicillium antarcticum]OQD87161.1 hypothetical protein PENANT_c006G09338 [Penicillium antarcticum]
MNPVSPWLAALAEQCLLFYLGRNSYDGIQVEDHEGCLNFSIRGLVMSAIIEKWGQGEEGDRATLTDSMNHIDAIFSRDSLNEHEATSPCPSTIKYGPKRQLIDLLDVKLALLYSTKSSDIELRVNRFRIRWNEVTKGEPPKPKLKKAPAIKCLMKEACRRTQTGSADARPNGQEDVALAVPSAPQFDQPVPPGSQIEPMGSQLFSQVLSNTNYDAQRYNSKETRVSLNKEAMLQLLKPSDGPNKTKPDSHSPSLGDSHSRQSPSQNGRTPIESGTPFTYKPWSTSADAACTDPSDANSLRPNTCNDTLEPLAIERQLSSSSTGLVDRDATANGDVQQNHDLSKKRQRDSMDVSLQASYDNTDSQTQRKSVIQAPSNKRQRIDTEDTTKANLNGTKKVLNEPAPKSVLSEVPDLPVHDLLPDPWDGMTKIPANDVHIPKEQTDLFEPLVWIQQVSSESAPLCHVPPRLLSRWNDVAQRRKLLAEKEDRRIENPIPTPQDTYRSESVAESEISSQSSEPLSGWSEASEKVPPDSPSPTKSRNIKEGTTPSGTQSSAYQIANDSDVDMVNGSRATSRSAREAAASQIVPDTVAQRQSQAPDESTIISRETEFQPQDSGDDPSHEHNNSGSRIENAEQTSNQIPEAQGGMRSGSPPAAPESLSLESSGDESDEDEMETSVPYGLGASIPPSSQPEQQIGSSGNSSGLLLPRILGKPSTLGKGVQVVETPAVQTTHSLREEGNEAVEPELSSTQPSSQAAKTSSQSRILATYHSQETSTQSDPSQEVQTPSLPIEGESLRVDVLGTQIQTSASHTTSQETPKSHTEFVLDSSKTAQREWDSSMFGSQPSANPLSFASSHPQPMSQLNELSQNFMREMSSLDGTTYFPGTSLGDSSGWTAPDAESPSKPPKTKQTKGIDTRMAFQSPNGELVARRQSFIDKPDQTAQALMFYEKFCNDYPLYFGDFAHFIEMCAKLQGLRENGALKRSFLWDDFVIMNLEEYQHHVEECASQDSKILKYEDFFCSNFSRPRHKKRSLTTRAVNVTASQFAPPDSTTSSNQPPPCPAHTQGKFTNPSFTASLVDKLSDLHTRSFDTTSASGVFDGPSSKTDVSAATQPAVQVKLEQDVPSTEVLDSQAPTTSSDGQNPVLPSSEQWGNSTQHDEDDTQVKPEMSDVDMSEADDSQEVDNTHHRTASIELGDDSEDRHSSHVSLPTASTKAPAEVATSTEDVQQEAQRPRPWFRSLRNIFPTGPVWSDDPNTPFKRWAREDQNVLQELNRRGGAKIQLDEKGVICRPTYKSEQSPGSI